MSLYFDLGANRSLSNLDAEGEEKFTDKQDTLVSGENIKTINGVSVLGEGNIEVGEGGTITVNQTYDPTSSYAQSGTAVKEALTNSMEAVSQNGTISNCILEIPQNIKMEISGSNVICKAGSVLVNSGSTYQTITLTQDCVQDCSSFNDTTFLFMVHVYGSGPVQMGFALDKTVSGATDSLAGTSYHTWFDTETKVIKRYSSDPNSYTQCCYPCALVQVTSGVPSFVKDSNGNDMIFNGAGFIGHHAFVYPGVKALIPNGFNDDGSLKSVSTTTNTLIITELNRSATAIWITNDGVSTGYSELEELPPNPINYFSYYIKSQNRLMVYNGISWAPRNRTMAVGYSTVNNIVTDFTIRQPVRLATTEMLDKVQDQVDTNTSDIANKQETLVSGTNIKTINSTSVLGSGNFTLADQSLSNLDSTGQMVVDSQNGTVSNCILEIPQNIKMEISADKKTITLKSGSTCVKSGSTYTTITTIADVSWTNSSNTARRCVFLLMDSGSWCRVREIEYFVSGSTDSLAGTTWHCWFDTDNKEIKFYATDASSYGLACYPCCVFDIDSNGDISFAKDSKGRDLIFNGCGYIGHHAFVYPNVKGLYPNGFNADGTLKSGVAQTNALYIREMGTGQDYTGYNRRFSLNGNGQVGVWRAYKEIDNLSEGDSRIYFRNYVKNENLIYNGTGSGYNRNSGDVECTPFIEFYYDGSTVTQFDIRQPYEGARNLLTDELQADVTTITGYDSTQTQTLKNINGVLQWVTD